MPLRNARPLLWRPTSVSDTQDATNAFPGAMQTLSDVIPSQATPRGWVPRPAAEELTDFSTSGFATVGYGSALMAAGSRVYGMIGTTDPAGYDRPFCFDVTTLAFTTIDGVTAANLPRTQSTIGDWDPPSMVMVGKRILVTHPGFGGAATGYYFGWIDMSAFSGTATGDTVSTNATIAGLSINPLNVGWQPGFLIAAAELLPGTIIVSLTASSVTVYPPPIATTTGATLTVTGGDEGAPLWGAGNTNTNPLSAVPRWVTQFNGRAYYAVGNGVVLSDSLNPCRVTNATQALTLGDNQPVTVLAGLPLNNQYIGGVIQSVIAFKGDQEMFQITGDPATSNLAVNEINVPTGTLAPRTVTPTPLGLAFISPVGLRILGLDGTVSEVIGNEGEGVARPFQSAIWPTRMCACFNQNVLRVSVKSSEEPSDVIREWWFDFKLKAWSGPHSIQPSTIQPYQALSDHGFVLFVDNVRRRLWRSSCIPAPDDSFVENTHQLTWEMETALLPDSGNMNMNAVVETTIAAQIPANSGIRVRAVNEVGEDLDVVEVLGDTFDVGVWGPPPSEPGVWGPPAIWGSPPGVFKQRRVEWTVPLTFKQMSIRITGESMRGLVVENIYLCYQELGYLLPG